AAGAGSSHTADAALPVALRGQPPRPAARVPERLPHLARDEPRELLRALGGEVAEAAQHAGARFEARGTPRDLRATRARDGRVDGRRVGDREAPDLVARVRRRDAAQELRHGSGVTLTSSPAATPSASREALETSGAPASSSGTTVARKPSRPSAESSARCGCGGTGRSCTRPGSTRRRRSRTETIASRAAPT